MLGTACTSASRLFWKQVWQLRHIANPYLFIKIISMMSAMCLVSSDERPTGLRCANLPIVIIILRWQRIDAAAACATFAPHFGSGCGTVMASATIHALFDTNSHFFCPVLVTWREYSRALDGKHKGRLLINYGVYLSIASVFKQLESHIR